MLAFSARGFGESCGSAASRLADPVGCAQGWVRLDDVRYEARDIQQLAGLLADAGVVDGQKVGVTGGSYGGGVSLDLAVLRDRVMLPDGSLRAVDLSPPGGRCASPPPCRGSRGAISPTRWRPTGARSTTRSPSPTADLEPFGIAKQSFVAGLYASGQASGYYAPAGRRPRRRPQHAGSPRSTPASPTAPQERAIADELAAHHSAYYLDHSRAPAPTLIANGWTDDLFPVDEALRYYNRTRAQYPGAPLSLMFLDFGHQRGQNKDADVARFEQRAYAWMDRYVKGDASAPALQGVEALTQTCPKTAPSGGPYDAPTWGALHPGEVRFASSAAQTVLSAGGDPAVARAFDPIAGDGACATTSAADEPGHRVLPPAGGDRRGLHAARRADGHRRPEAHGQLPGAGAAPARRGAGRDPDARGAGPLSTRRPTGARSSSCIPARGASLRATSPGSSSWGATRPTGGRRTGPSRWACARSSCACRCVSGAAQRCAGRSRRFRVADPGFESG